MSWFIGHIHTWYSYDSLTRPAAIVEYARGRGLDYLVICDHDDVSGSLAAAAYAKKMRYDIDIPMAAEYATEVGDIIVVGNHDPFAKPLQQPVLCRIAKERGCQVILPHPFTSHYLSRIDFTHLDYIEVFNSRCSSTENGEAERLAREKGKRPFFGADAHFIRDLSNAICWYDGSDPFAGEMRLLSSRATDASSVALSQTIKGIRKGDLKLVANSSLRLLSTGVKTYQNKNARAGKGH